MSLSDNKTITQKPHAVCMPYPAQGHVNPFMQLAKLLHSHGFHITFVNTEFNHRRLAKSLGPDFVKGLPDFRFETIPDGLPPSEKDATQDIPALCDSTSKHCYEPFKELIEKLNSSSSSQEDEVPRVSSVISDGLMGFANKVAEDLGIHGIRFWTSSACGLLAYLHYDELVKRGIVPFKDESFLVDGTLDTTIDWVKGMKDMRLKDMPSFIRVTNLEEDIMFNFLNEEAKHNIRSSSIILNTFQEVDSEILDALMPMNPNIYNIGPLHFLSTKHLVNNGNNNENGFFRSSGSASFWKSDSKCVDWLEKWEPNSVIYVNYGSITVMSEQQLEEFAWGLANSKHPFLWVLRPDLVKSNKSTENTILPLELLDEIKDRGYITSWCPQEQVLAHPSVGVFLTHCGWNSTLESISAGVPMICWPFFADQQANCWFVCKLLKIGLELKDDVKREEIASVVKEAIEGENGKEMRKRSLVWKTKAEEATDIGGSAHNDLKKLIKDASLSLVGKD